MPISVMRSIVAFPPVVSCAPGVVNAIGTAATFECAPVGAFYWLPRLPVLRFGGGSPVVLMPVALSLPPLVPDAPLPVSSEPVPFRGALVVNASGSNVANSLIAVLLTPPDGAPGGTAPVPCAPVVRLTADAFSCTVTVISAAVVAVPGLGMTLTYATVLANNNVSAPTVFEFNTTTLTLAAPFVRPALGAAQPLLALEGGVAVHLLLSAARLSVDDYAAAGLPVPAGGALSLGQVTRSWVGDEACVFCGFATEVDIYCIVPAGALPRERAVLELGGIVNASSDGLPLGAPVDSSAPAGIYLGYRAPIFVAATPAAVLLPNPSQLFQGACPALNSTPATCTVYDPAILVFNITLSGDTAPGANNAVGTWLLNGFLTVTSVGGQPCGYLDAPSPTTIVCAQWDSGAAATALFPAGADAAPDNVPLAINYLWGPTQQTLTNVLIGVVRPTLVQTTNKGGRTSNGGAVALNGVNLSPFPSPYPLPVITIAGQPCTSVFRLDANNVNCVAPAFFPSSPPAGYPSLPVALVNPLGVAATSSLTITYPTQVLSAYWSSDALAGNFFAIPSDGVSALLPVQQLVATAPPTDATAAPIYLNITGSGLITCSLSLTSGGGLSGDSASQVGTADCSAVAFSVPGYGLAFSSPPPASSAAALLVGGYTASATLDINGGVGSVSFPSVGVLAPAGCSLQLFAACSQGAASFSTADLQNAPLGAPNPALTVTVMSLYGGWLPSDNASVSASTALNLPLGLPALAASFVWSYSAATARDALANNALATVTRYGMWPDPNATRLGAPGALLGACVAILAPAASADPAFDTPLSVTSAAFLSSSTGIVADGSGAVHQANFSMLSCAACSLATAYTVFGECSWAATPQSVAAPRLRLPPLTFSVASVALTYGTISSSEGFPTGIVILADFSTRTTGAVAPSGAPFSHPNISASAHTTRGRLTG